VSVSPIGGAVLSGDFSGTLFIDTYGRYSYAGNAAIEFTNVFAAPYDIFDTTSNEMNNPNRPSYSLLNNNCGTFAHAAIAAGR